MSTNAKKFNFTALCDKVEKMRETYHAYLTDSNLEALTIKMQAGKNADANLDKWLEALDNTVDYDKRVNLQGLISADNFTVSRAIDFVESLERKMVEKERDEKRKINSDKVGMLPEKTAKLQKLIDDYTMLALSIQELTKEVVNLEVLREKMINAISDEDTDEVA